MIVRDSAMNLQGSSSRHLEVERQERLAIWRGAAPMESRRPPQPNSPAARVELGRSEDFRLGNFARLAGRAMGHHPAAGREPPPVQKADAADETVNEEDFIADTQLRMLAGLFEMLTGKKAQMIDLREFRGEEAEVAVREVAQAYESARNGGGEDWGMRYDAVETRIEHQELSFSAKGQVTTEDGRSFEISLDVNMSRTFVERNEVHLEAGNAVRRVDPLVLHFDGLPDAMSQERFQFDLDNDGTMDMIPFVGPGSGVLAWDKNGNGKVDNGSELFGPVSGNGFAELARHDADGNGFIDEADPIFDGLRVWMRDEEGKDRLLALGVKGVGAIFLGYANGDLSLRDGAGNEAGQVRRSGLYLKEEGGSGLMQQVDLVL